MGVGVQPSATSPVKAECTDKKQRPVTLQQIGHVFGL